MDRNMDRCPSCGVSYIDHLGIIGTCRELQESRAEVQRLNQALKWEQDRSGRIGTHADGCYQWGPAHYDDVVKQRNDWHGMYEDEYDRAESYKQALQRLDDIKFEPAYCWEQSQFVKRIVRKALRGGEG